MSWFWWMLIIVGGLAALSLLITWGLRLIFYLIGCREMTQNYGSDWREQVKESNEKSIKKYDDSIKVLQRCLKEDGVEGNSDSLDYVILLTESSSLEWGCWDSHQTRWDEQKIFTAQLTEKIRIFLERETTIWRWPLFWPYYKEVRYKLNFIESGWLNPGRKDRFDRAGYYWMKDLPPWISSSLNNKKVKRLFDLVKTKATKSV